MVGRVERTGHIEGTCSTRRAGAAPRSTEIRLSGLSRARKTALERVPRVVLVLVQQAEQLERDAPCATSNWGNSRDQRRRAPRGMATDEVRALERALLRADGGFP